MRQSSSGGVFSLGKRERKKGEGRGKTCLWGQEQQKRRGGRDRGGGVGKAHLSKGMKQVCAQEVLLVEVPDPKGRPEQMPEY